MLESAVTEGTGTHAAVAGYRIAGKTGTAETSTEKPDAWFAAYAPYDAPQIVVIVLVENVGQGSAVAAPVLGS